MSFVLLTYLVFLLISILKSFFTLDVHIRFDMLTSEKLRGNCNEDGRVTLIYSKRDLEPCPDYVYKIYYERDSLGSLNVCLYTRHPFTVFFLCLTFVSVEIIIVVSFSFFILMVFTSLLYTLIKFELY